MIKHTVFSVIILHDYNCAILADVRHVLTSADNAGADPSQQLQTGGPAAAHQGVHAAREWHDTAGNGTTLYTASHIFTLGRFAYVIGIKSFIINDESIL